MHPSIQFTLFFTLLSLLFCSLTIQAQGLPANPDPNKCYVRTVTVGEYAIYWDSIYTYTEEDAMQFAHQEVQIVVAPAISRWETTYYKDCESDDPTDCEVRCYKTYPAQTITFYEPQDLSLGNPYWDYFEVEELIREGEAAYEEIDCELTSDNRLPIDFIDGASLTPEDCDVIDRKLLELLLDRPNLKVQINAHTSTLGNSADNQHLSEWRAAGILNYLVSKGIRSERLIAKGFGASQPKNRCGELDCTAERHAENKRVEFRVLNMDR